jgi:hypothetical protein
MLIVRPRPASIGSLSFPIPREHMGCLGAWVGTWVGLHGRGVLAI